MGGREQGARSAIQARRTRILEGVGSDRAPLASGEDRLGRDETLQYFLPQGTGQDDRQDHVDGRLKDRLPAHHCLRCSPHLRPIDAAAEPVTLARPPCR